MHYLLPVYILQRCKRLYEYFHHPVLWQIHGLSQAIQVAVEVPALAVLHDQVQIVVVDEVVEISNDVLMFYFAEDVCFSQVGFVAPTVETYFDFFNYVRVVVYEVAAAIYDAKGALTHLRLQQIVSHLLFGC